MCLLRFHDMFVFNSLFTQVLLLALSLVSITVILLQTRYLQFLRGYVGKTFYRLQAVPFWIVERSCEMAEREKTGANERCGRLGERREKGEGNSLLSPSLFLFISPRSSLAAL